MPEHWEEILAAANLNRTPESENLRPDDWGMLVEIWEGADKPEIELSPGVYVSDLARYFNAPSTLRLKDYLSYGAYETYQFTQKDNDTIREFMLVLL